MARYLIFILVMVTMGQTAIDIYMPSLPAMKIHLGASHSQVQLTLTVFLIAFASSQLFYGPLSDRFGRKPILTFGISLYSVASIASVFSPTIGFLLVVRAIQGLGVGVCSVLSRAITRDVYEGTDINRVASYQGIAWSTVPIVAPAFGGYIQAWFGWRGNFAVQALAGLIVLICLLLFLPETHDPKHRQSFHPLTTVRNYWSLLTNRSFVGTIVSVTLLYGSIIAFAVTGPFLLQSRLGLSPIEYGWMAFLAALGSIVGNWINAHAIKRFSDRRIMFWGGLLYIASAATLLGLGLAGIFTVAAVIAPITAFFFSLGFLYSNCIAKAIAPFPRVAGSASALFGTFAFTGGALASAIAAYLPETDAIPLAITLLCISLAAFGTVQLLAFRKET